MSTMLARLGHFWRALPRLRRERRVAAGVIGLN
jgi:hypothetical protein